MSMLAEYCSKKTCLSVHVSGPVTCVTLYNMDASKVRAYIFSIFSVQVRKLESSYVENLQ